MSKKYSCSSNLFASHDLETLLKHVSEIGCNYVDLWFSPPFCKHVDPFNDNPVELKKIVSSYNLNISALTIYFTTYEEKMKSLEFAAEMEIPYIVLEPSPLDNFYEKMSNIDVKGRTLGEPGIDFDGFVELLNTYVQRGKELGVKIALEVPHVYTLTETIEEVEAVLKEISSDYLLLTMAPPHIIARGGNIENAISRLGEKTAIYYLWDVKEGYKYPDDDRAFGTGKQQIPGHGMLNLVSIIDQLKSKGFTGFWDIKCHGTEGWANAEQISSLVKEGMKLIIPKL